MEAATCKMCAMLDSSKQYFIVVILAILLLPLITRAKPQGGEWNFLSATTTVDTDRRYPSFLYSTDTNGTKKLHVVRRIVSGEEGVHSVHWYGNAIFVVYPHLPPTTVSVVHTDKPALQDAVVFDPEEKVVIDSRLGMAESRERGVCELFLLSKPEDRSGGTVVSVAATPSNEGQRIARNAWSEYSFLRFDGMPGGPVAQPALAGSFAEDSLGIKVSNKYVMVDRLPASIAQRLRGETPYYLAANDEHLIFGTLFHLEDLESGAAAKKINEIVYVHDLHNSRWTTVTLDGSSSRTRIFGPWLATIVQFWDPHHTPNPGADHERDVETANLPSVRAMYAMSAGRDWRIPGMLVLRNMRTGQKITLRTGEEDSEVIGMHEGTVLYRVNDKIYQATLDGESLKETKLIVEDEDVPEIHWAFWSQ